MLVGTGLIVAPVGFGLGIAAGMTGVIVGALCVALALAGTETSGRGTIPLSAHAVYDRGLGLGLVLSAVAFGVVGETRRDGALRLHRRRRAGGDLDHALQRKRLLKTSSPRSHIASLLPQETAPLRRGRFSFWGQ